MGGQLHYQLVLPQECRSEALAELHDKMGHLGIDRTLDLVRSRFYWPKLAVDVTDKIKSCERCIKRKALPEKAAPLVNIRTSRPLELVCIDFLSIEPDCSRTKDVLVITDHFTKYAVAVPTPNQKAKTVAKCLWDNFFVHYGIPEKLHSDQGTDFESRTIKELCKIAGIHKVRTTPYHPRGNPVERFNRTLLNMLGTLTNEDKLHWKDFVKPLVHAYNCTRNDVTGFTPYELMFGRQPRLPIDLVFGVPMNDDSQTHSQYIQTLKETLEKSYQIAMKNSEKVMRRNKSRFDKHVTTSDLQTGDRVLVKNVKLRGKHKLADKWEPTVYIVVRRAGSLPVYTVRPEHSSRPLRTLHRDLLLPCGYLSGPCKSTLRSSRRLNRATLALPQDDPDEELCSDDELIPVHWYYPSEPKRFTTVMDLPQDPVVVQSNDAAHRGPVVQQHIPEMPSGSTSEPADETGKELTVESPQSENVEAIAEPSSSEDMSPSSPDSDAPVRRPTRTRKPPDRLQYNRLGHPILNSLQTFFHGLSTAFSHDPEDMEAINNVVTPSIVCSQPSNVRGRALSKGGNL